jgi:hypothetical protein
MEINEPEEAEKYFEAYVAWLMKRWNIAREEAEANARSNLGYFAGYYDRETMERVARLFGAEHPIFGGAKAVSAEEAFQLGLEQGRAAKDKPE